MRVMLDSRYFPHCKHTLLRYVCICVLCLFCNLINGEYSSSNSKRMTLQFKEAFEEHKMSHQPIRPTQDTCGNQESSDEPIETKLHSQKLHQKQEMPSNKISTNGIQHPEIPVQSHESQQNGKQVFVPVKNTVTVFSYILLGLGALAIFAIIFLGYLKLTNLLKQHLSSANMLCKININTDETVQKIRICPRCGWKRPLGATECINPKCRTRF